VIEALLYLRCRMKKEEKYNARMEAKGYVKTCQWVPKEYRAEHIAHAHKLRKRRERKGDMR